MHALIIGAAGMIGRKLTAGLVGDGVLGDQPLERLTLADVVVPTRPDGDPGLAEVVAADLTEPGAAERLLETRPDVVFHLAAVVSGEAEADFDKGYRVNLDGTRALLEAIRAANLADGYHPRVVFTSSIAVYGAPLPNPIPEDLQQTPLTSYGTQKAIGELLLADFTRRGFLDGIGVRLPTICIRPGQAQPGGLRVLLEHPARAAGRAGGRAARARDRPALARVAALGRAVPGPGGRARHRSGRTATHAVDAGAERDGG